MKNNLKWVTLALFVLIGLTGTKANAQLQLGLSANHYSFLEEGVKFSDGFWGGGITARYFVSPKFAVGLNGRYFTRSESSQGLSVSINVIPVTGQAEFFFTEGKVRPYVGAEAGVHVAIAKISVLGESESDSDSNLAVAPKAGIQFMFTDKIGLDLNAGYHLVFPKDSGGETAKALILGAGVVFNFGH